MEKKNNISKSIVMAMLVVGLTLIVNAYLVHSAPSAADGGGDLPLCSFKKAPLGFAAGAGSNCVEAANDALKKAEENCKQLLEMVPTDEKCTPNYTKTVCTNGPVVLGATNTYTCIDVVGGKQMYAAVRCRLKCIASEIKPLKPEDDPI